MRKASKRLTQRQAQVAALKAVGASAKEIGLILDVSEQTVKTYQKQLRVIQKLNNIDYWGLPLDRTGRTRAFKQVLNNLKAQYNFGDTANEDGSRTEENSGQSNQNNAAITRANHGAIQLQ